MDANERKEQIELLIDLQEKERRIEQIRADLERIPRQAEQMREALSDLDARIRSEQESEERLKKSYRASEAEAQNHQSRIQKRESQLRSVKTNQEYRALLKEIEEIRSATSALEDRMLQDLEEMEAAEAAIRRLRTDYREEEARIAEKVGELESQAEKLREEKARLKADSEALIPHIDAGILKKYRFAQQQAGGLAVVAARNSTCTGCNMNIPPQLFNELYRWDELRFCPHCHRILYVL